MLKNEPRLGYWCECWTEDLTQENPPTLLASFDAYSAPQADRWIAVTLSTITPGLDSGASDEAWAWLYEGRIETRQALLQAKPCTVSVTHASTRITWTIRRALFMPLAHRQGIELPTCAHDFTPQPTQPTD
ncbi:MULTISPECIES: hypothetical protein [unclassified Streptomyces]|uniref:hypothetical protein n=1 Tax=unclassified Streptomyces TaxID=2593676 RepID=UPI002E80310B|nr:hypothetical protein [Streptomyces sp. NBC_00589]WTI37721.1 hypothetical protein OIC96_23285 [Streptomyces sp. NBC_00775]WUB28600.1 hypothetical protein OHA51_26450 [Streptomyces sp. NBC_00589]